MFETRNQLKERIAALEADAETHDQAIEEANQRVTDAEAAQETAISERDSVTAERDEARDDLTAAQERIAELEAENARIPELEQAASPEQIAIEASRILASTGVPPVDVNETNSDPADVWAQYEAITDPGKRTKFWRENEAKLKATIRK